MSFERYRIELVKLVDTLLDILDTGPAYKHFTLDAQMVNLEDYLQIKHKNKKKIKKYIRDGRILIGPWYVAADEFLPGNESLIRNLFLGQKISNEYGGTAIVGYLPDQFGHISQMPQVLNGFGIESAVIWRGIGMSMGASGSEFIWESPDGSRVLTHRLSSRGKNYDIHGYHNAVYLSADEKTASERIEKIRQFLSQDATTPNLLLMNGHDSVMPDPEVPSTIEKVNKILKNGRVVHSSLPKFIRDIRRSKPRLKTVKGEFYNCRYSKIHPGVLSCRIHSKQANEESENLLFKWAEPFASVCWLDSGSYPGELLEQSCKYLLKNHPHDSVCGCSLDEIDKAMMFRYLQSQEISDEITAKSLDTISTRIDTSSLDKDESCLVVFNPLNWPRTDLISASVCFPIGLKTDGFTLEDRQGNIIPYYVCRKEEDIFFPLPNRFLRYGRGDCFHIVFVADDIPAIGYKSYLIKPGRKKISFAPGKKLSPGNNTLENEYIKVRINSDGTFDLTGKKNGIVCRNCNAFKDGGDIGNLFDYSYPLKDKIVTSLGRKDAEIILKTNTKFITEYQVTVKLFLPARMDPGRKKRFGEYVEYPIISTIRLCKGVPRVDVETVVDNNVKDHRLQVLFPSGIKTDFSHAEGQFDVIKRPVKIPSFKGTFAIPMPTFPQQSFVDLSGRGKGLAVFNRGLPSYEVIDDEKRTIALTLLRCVEWLTAPDLLTIHNVNAGTFFKFSPGGQCQGRYVFHYSLYPHSGNWEKGKVYHQAYQHNIDCRTAQTDKHDGDLPPELSLMRLEPDNLVLSCLKKSDKRNSLILRLFNPSSKKVQARVLFHKKLKKTYVVNLAEKRKKTLMLKNGTIVYSVPGKKIVTFELVPV